MTITYRGTKGSKLTFAEMDENFRHLDVKTADGWKDLVYQLSIYPAAPNPPGVGLVQGGMYLPTFPANATTNVFASAHIGHDYKRDTILYPHMHWLNNGTADPGNVRWGYEYSWARRGDSTGQVTFTAPQIIYVHQSDGGVPFSHRVAEMSEGQGIPSIGMEPDVVIMFRIFRDGTNILDTYEDTVYGITFDLHYQTDRDATPSRVPPFYT